MPRARMSKLKQSITRWLEHEHALWLIPLMFFVLLSMYLLILLNHLL